MLICHKLAKMQSTVMRTAGIGHSQDNRVVNIIENEKDSQTVDIASLLLDA